MDILSWNVKQVFDDGTATDITGFPTKRSAEIYINKRNHFPCKIVPDYWEQSYRTPTGELDLNVDI